MLLSEYKLKFLELSFVYLVVKIELQSFVYLDVKIELLSLLHLVVKNSEINE